MKRNIAIRALLVLVFSVLGCFVLFGCDNASLPADLPEVKDVSLTAEDSALYGKAGVLHRLAYTAAEGATVSTSVELGGKAATSSDYSARAEGFLFYTAGEYTVTVYAAKDGLVGQASVKIQIAASTAYINGVQIVAADGYGGKTGALHSLVYDAPAESEIAVTFEKDGAPSQDAQYDPARKTVVFRSAGNYTVTVTASLNGASASDSAQFAVTALEAPEVTLSAAKTTVKEEETVTLERGAVFADFDRCSSENITVLYRKGNSGSYKDADEESYTLNGDLFTPHTAGRWKLVYEVNGMWSGTGEDELLLTSSAASMTLSAKTAGRQRIQNGVPTEIVYSAKGALDKYNVSFDTHGNGNVTVTKGEGCSLVVTAAKTDYFTVSVIYTHKVNTATKQQIDLDFYSVENLVYAPFLGEDPFCGMPSETLTFMGHLLYFDATPCGVEGRKLTNRDVSYKILESNVNGAVEVLYVAGDEDYPYLIQSNGEDCVATGSYTLQATVTDPITGYSAIATKRFTVTPTTNDNTAAAKCITDYVAKYPGFFQMKDMSFANIGHDSRKNVVLTKTGAIIHRTNASWPLGNGPEFGCADPAAQVDCRLAFDFRLYGENASGGANLDIQVMTGGTNSSAGTIQVGVANGKFFARQSVNGQSVQTGQMPAVAMGQTVSLRLARKVSGTTVTFTLSAKTESEYVTCLSFTAPVSSSAGDIGTPVARYQFKHSGGGGCFAVENVTLAAL